MNLLEDWKLWWDETQKERPEYDLKSSDTWRVASKYRNPEDKDWWFTNGYKFYESWVDWRKANPHMSIARTSDGVLAVELEASVKISGVEVKMFIDRVFYDENTKQYVIVDLKTGKNVPKSKLQLGFYSYGLRHLYGIDAQVGAYWMARQGGLTQYFNLAAYDDSKIESLVSMFDKARKENIFIPNYDACNMCGFTATCEWYMKETNE